MLRSEAAVGGVIRLSTVTKAQIPRQVQFANPSKHPQIPMFKGVWSTAVNFVLVPPPDTKLAQYPPPDKRSDDSLGRHGLGGWAYCPRRSARASLA